MAEISGYAARFGDEANIGGEFRERLKPGSFTRTLRENPDVFMLLGHDIGRVLGRTTAGSLTLREDRIGLWFSLTVDPTTPDGQTALGTIGRGDVRSMSFGFNVREEEWSDGGLRLPLRTLVDVDLFEISAVAVAAYETTSAAVVRSDAPASDSIAAFRRAEAKMRARGITI